jgi:hypothetical protein
MFQSIYTEHLKQQGWIEVEPMSFKKPNIGYEIFFDTSSQIEIYNGKLRVKSVYLQSLRDLTNVLNDLLREYDLE